MAEDSRTHGAHLSGLPIEQSMEVTFVQIHQHILRYQHEALRLMGAQPEVSVATMAAPRVGELQHPR